MRLPSENSAHPGPPAATPTERHIGYGGDADECYCARTYFTVTVATGIGARLEGLGVGAGLLSQPTWPFIASARTRHRVAPPPDDEPLFQMWSRLPAACEQIGQAPPQGRKRATITALRLMIHRDYDRRTRRADADVRTSCARIQVAGLSVISVPPTVPSGRFLKLPGKLPAYSGVRTTLRRSWAMAWFRGLDRYLNLSAYMES